MKRINITLLLVVFLKAVIGQPISINNRYDFNGLLETGPNIIEVPDGYIVAGEGVNSTWSYFYEILKIDKNGNSEWKKKYGKDGFTYGGGVSGSLIKTYDNNFTDAGIFIDTAGNFSALLIKFDNNGDTLWTKKWRSGNNWGYAAHSCKQAPDHGYLIIGVSDAIDWDGDFLLIKTDSMGNLEWEKTFGGEDIEQGTSITLTKDGGYLLGGYSKSFGGGDYDAYIIKTDNSGNQEWFKTYGDTGENGAFYITATTDGGYIASGAQIQYYINVFPQAKPYIMKLDSVGNIIWDKTYGPVRYVAAGGSIFELSDGSFVTAGQSNNNINGSNGDGWPIGFILKVNSKGDSLWYREFQYDSCEKNFDYVRDMKPTSDGGFIVAGFFTPITSTECNDTGTQDMWVIKLDSMGCPFPGCDTIQGVIYLKPQASKISVYPNPAHTVAKIYGLPKEKNIELSVYDIMGRIVTRLTIPPGDGAAEINLYGYETGVYFLKFTFNNELISAQKLIINR